MRHHAAHRLLRRIELIGAARGWPPGMADMPGMQERSTAKPPGMADMPGMQERSTAKPPGMVDVPGAHDSEDGGGRSASATAAEARPPA